MIATTLHDQTRPKKIKKFIKIMKVPIEKMWGDKQQGRKATETDRWLASTAKKEERVSEILSNSAWLTIN